MAKKDVLLIGFGAVGAICMYLGDDTRISR